MSFQLETSDGRSLTVNVWNWGTLHHHVARAGILPEGDWEPMRFNGGGELAPEQVQALASFLEGELLPKLGEGQRMFFDGSVTDVPDDGTLHRGEAELWKNYSLSRAVLVEVIGLLKSATGPVSIL
jgi:hypothetical protein